MVLLRLVISSIALVSLVSCWNCDDRCPDYEACLQEEIDRGNRRILQVEDERKAAHDLVSGKQGLRGEQQQRKREMGASSTMTRFLFRMYHEESREYCWQSEWKDRGWCMECEECEEDDGCSGECDEGDRMWIQFCNDDESAQYFVYEEVSGTGGGRIKPYDDQSLCFEKPTGSNEMILEPCEDGNMAQILLGFDMTSPFELHPYGLGPDSSSPRCLSQPHHPKKYELIMALSCANARADSTSKWIVYEAIYVDGTPLVIPPGPSPAPSPAPSDENAIATGSPVPSPPLNDVGSCSPTSPCGHCEGDCDRDSDCEDNLECFHRTWLEEVPSCSGGDTIDNRGDFCVPPEYNDRPEVVDDGASACSNSDPCEHCYGDCDDDSECEGTLECFRRQYGEAVPSCRGGEYIENSRDFCVPPEYN